jgi:hypothetical protein
MKLWLKRTAAVVVVWAVTLGFALFIDRHPQPIALAAGVAAVLSVVWLCVDAYQDPGPADWSLYRAPAPARTFDPRFSRLSQQLNEADDRQEASVAVRTSLSAVADRLLLDKYEVDRHRDPESAARILGDQVWRYLTSDADADQVTFSPQLFAVLDTMEAL